MTALTGAILRQQGWSLAVFLGVILIIAISNVFFMRKLKPPAHRIQYKVSLLVPARNEEANIEKCVRSLLSQQDVDIEVIVYDDGSTDSTPDILERLSSVDGRLKVMKGGTLTPGWTGKNMACWSLANASSGNVLIFTDADTYHSPHSASSACKALEDTGAGLVSGMVRQDLKTAGEMLVVPVLNWALVCFMPVILIKWIKNPFFSSACGQLMAFKREDYFASGGHEKIKGCVLEDMELARTMKRTGRKALLFDATKLVNCRMYTGFRNALAGFTKNLFAVFRNSISMNLFVWSWLTLSTVTPFLYLISASSHGDPSIIRPAVVSVSIALCIWLVSYVKSKVPVWLAFIYPVSMLFWTFIAMGSMVVSLLGLGRWKDRGLPRTKVRLV